MKVFILCMSELTFVGDFDIEQIEKAVKINYATSNHNITFNKHS